METEEAPAELAGEAEPGEGERGDVAGARVASDAVPGAGPLVVLAPRREAAIRV
jgi:hypothetical protein